MLFVLRVLFVLCVLFYATRPPGLMLHGFNLSLPHAIHETRVSLPVVPAVRGRARDCRWSEHTETSSRGRKQLLHSDNYSQYTGRIFAKSILAILFWPWSPSVWRVNNPTHLKTSTRYAS